MEQEPGIILNINGEHFEATRDNTSLFRYFGHLAVYNHVFIVRDEESGECTYIFNQHPTYPVFEEYMVKHKYETHDNLREVAECDLDAFEDMVKQNLGDIQDYPPEDWS